MNRCGGASFLAANCGERGGAGCQGHAAYAVDHGRALTASTTTHNSGHYEEGRPVKESSRRYGQDYATDDERRTAYQDFKTSLATMHAAFSQPDDMHVAGYLEAHERVASGDADGPADAEVWVPTDLNGLARADWLEGFRSHFEP